MTFEEQKKINFDYLNENAELSKFEYTEKTSYDQRTYEGGILTCKICGKKRSWKDWGRGEARARRWFDHHSITVHHSPIINRYFIEEWIDQKLKEARE